MGKENTKQILNVYDKPVIVYTLEGFQRHAEIDAIEVVCLEGWSEMLVAYAKQFNIDKLRWVIHDGIRPMVEDFVLTDVLVKCREYGNAVTSLPYNEQIFVSGDGTSTTQYIPRDTLRRVSTPQAYRYEKLLWAYEKAFAQGIGIQGATYANTLMTDLGERLYFAAGSEKNIKLTTRDDFELFKTYMKMEKDGWLK